MNTMFPIFLKIENKKCIIIGGGKVALQKIKGLIDTNANIEVISKDFNKNIIVISKNKNVKLIKKEYEKADINNAFIVFACTNNSELNKQIYSDCEEKKIIVNVADSPDLCNFFLPAIVNRGDLKIAVSTNGKCCSLAKRIRQELEEKYDEKYEKILLFLGMLRDYLKDTEKDIKIRKDKLTKIVFQNNLEKMMDKIAEIDLNTIDVSKEIKKWT